MTKRSNLSGSWSSGGSSPPPSASSSSDDDLAAAAPAPAPNQGPMVIKITNDLHRTCRCPGPSPRIGPPRKRFHTNGHHLPSIYKAHPQGHRAYPLSLKPKWWRLFYARSHLPSLELKPTITYSLSPNMTVGALKDFLQRRHHPSRDFLLLHEHGYYYPSAVPCDATTLAQYGVNDGDSLRITSPPTIMVYIYNEVTRQHFKIWPSIYHTVSMVKEMIYKKIKHPPEIQILMAKNLDLHEKKYENRTLVSLGFKNDDEFHQINLHRPYAPDPYAYLKIRIQLLYRSPVFQVTIPINPESTINEFKRHVIAVEKCDYITFGNMRLEGSRTFSSYNIKEGDLLEIWEGYSRPPFLLSAPPFRNARGPPIGDVGGVRPYPFCREVKKNCDVADDTC